MRFAYPEFWPVLLGLPLAAGLLWKGYRQTRHLQSLGHLPTGGMYKYLPELKLGLRLIAVSCLAIATLGPYAPNFYAKDALLGRDLYILLDISASMNSTDVAPSRLHKGKRLIRQLLQKLQGDRVGLIVFSDDAFLQCPLTRDMEMFETLLQLAETRQFSATGTQYRPALSMALDHLQSEAYRERNKNQAVILISDGEDHGDLYTSLLDRYRKQRIPIFAVGIGTPKGTHIPADYMQPNPPQSPKKQPYSQLKDSSLIAIARSAKTSYFSISGAALPSTELWAQIETGMVAPLDLQQQQVQHSRYPYLVILALLVLGIGTLFLPQKAKT